eukprot:m51a1_g7126 putative probable rna-binding protein eif1ad (198) ;mRNA; r:173033-183274
MSHARKHLRAGLTGAGSCEAPDLSGNRHVARVTDVRGTQLLVLIPAKFRRVVWLKKGNYVVVEKADIPEDARYKVRGQLVQVLTEEQIKCMKRDSLWPEAFTASPAKDEAQPQAQAPQQQTAGTKQEASDEDEDDPFFSGGNPNRRAPTNAHMHFDEIIQAVWPPEFVTFFAENPTVRKGVCEHIQAVWRNQHSNES